MHTRASMMVIVALCCLVVGAQASAARPKAGRVKSGMMELCKDFEGGSHTIKDGVEVCCTREDLGDGKKGRFYCVECEPPGSDNCELWYGSRHVDPALVPVLADLRARQQGSLLEQQRIGAQVNELLTNLDRVLRRIEGMRETCASADLLPVPRPGSTDFCQTDEHGNLIVRVRNRGSATAPASTARVTFGTLAGPTPVVVELATPAVPGNDGVVGVATPIPGTCGSLAAGCPFEIAVDAGDVVFETDETNNVVSGTCPPPG